MKSTLAFLFGILLCIPAFCQSELVAGLSKPPVVMKQEYVTAYIKKVDSIQSLANKKVTLYNSENKDAIKNIDKSKMAQSYSNYGQPGGVSTSTVQGMQAAQQVALADQKKLDDVISGFKLRKDSIDLVYQADMKIFKEKYNKWLNSCAGAVMKEKETECDQMLGELNGERKSLLEKYFFGSAGLYSNYINSYIAAVTPLYIEAAKSKADYSEMTMMGVTVPHKEDLAYAELADDLVIMIHDAYNIEGGLWPLEK
jgi:hypothetical protein